MVTEPEAVVASHLFYPIVWPHGTTYYLVETSQRHYAISQPLIRDAGGKPVVLTEELGIGSIVRLAIGDDGLVRAVQIVAAAFDDPFAAFAEAAD